MAQSNSYLACFKLACVHYSTLPSLLSSLSTSSSPTFTSKLSPLDLHMSAFTFQPTLITHRFLLRCLWWQQIIAFYINFIELVLTRIRISMPYRFIPGIYLQKAFFSHLLLQHITMNSYNNQLTWSPSYNFVQCFTLPVVSWRHIHSGHTTI